MKKNYYLLFMLFFYISPLGAKNIFIRVFDQHGHSIAKGALTGTTDTSVLLRHGRTQLEIAIREIGTIKTKRSFGHPILVGAIAGAVSGGIIGLVANESLNADNGYFDVETSAGEDAVAGAIGGAIVGGVIGTIIAATSKRTTILISGDVNDWQQKRKILEIMLAENSKAREPK